MLQTLKKAAYSLLAFFLLLTILFILGVLWPQDTLDAVQTDTPIVVTNVSIVDLHRGQLVPNQTVVIQHQRIVFSGAPNAANLPSNTHYVDGTNHFLMPALWDMHTHIFKITPLLDLPLYTAFGVTNVRDMMSCPKANDPFVGCPEDFERWSQAAENAQLIGPRIQGITSWQSNGPSVHNYVKGLPEFFGTENPQQAREFVRHYATQYAGKVDAIKIYNHVSEDAYFAIADEAKKYALDLVGHRPYAVSAIDVARHQKSIEHARFILHESFSGSADLRKAASKGLWHEDRRRMLDEHNPEMANAIFKTMAETGTWYIPTHLTRRDDAYGDTPLVHDNPSLRFLHPLMKWQWLEDVNNVISNNPRPEARATYREFYHKGLELTGAAHKAGVKVLVGTDYIVAGASVHDELEQLVLAGLSPNDALRAATIYPAEYFGLQDQYGSVKAGMMADLILLSKNPLLDIQHTRSIQAVIFNGNLYDRNTLDAIHKLVEKRARSWSLACKIVWEFIKNPAAY